MTINSEFIVKVNVTCRIQNAAYKLSNSLVFLVWTWDLLLSFSCLLMSWTETVHGKLQPFACIATKFLSNVTSLFLVTEYLSVWCVSPISDFMYKGRNWCGYHLTVLWESQKSVFKTGRISEGVRDGMGSEVKY